MSLKALLTGEMVQISTPWVTEGDAAYVVFQKTPQLTGLQPEMRNAHDGIFVLRTRAEDPRIQSLADQASTLDAKHDAQARAIHTAFSALAMVSKSPEACVRLCDVLLPDGLQHLQRTYREEAGHAALVAAKLDDQTKAELKAITVHDVNMLDLVQGWLDTAKQLGDVEETRVRLANTNTGSGSETNQARMRWIRVVNAIQAVADMANLDEESDRILFSALRAAERTADNRGRASATTDPGTTTDKGPTGSTPTSK